MNTTRNTSMFETQTRDEEAASFLLSLKRNTDRRATVSPEPSSFFGGFRKAPLSTSFPPSMKANLGESLSMKEIVAKSPLVEPEDQDLVPDALLVSMAQMEPCRLNQSDRVGCYKSREIGFIGMSCKFCGGQPGFGRFFPATVRSLAQTTTSQTILKHISAKCRFVPAPIREMVVDLQHRSLDQEGLVSAGRPRYGSRKLFFQRVWSRLHEGNSPELTVNPVSSDDTPEEASEGLKRGATSTLGSSAKRSKAHS